MKYAVAHSCKCIVPKQQTPPRHPRTAATDQDGMFVWANNAAEGFFSSRQADGSLSDLQPTAVHQQDQQEVGGRRKSRC